MHVTDRIHTLFHPRSVAILGASRTIGKWGFTFTLHLTRGGYGGAVYPVNPAGGDLLGRKMYRSLGEIPGPVDLAFILLPPEKVAGAISECGAAGVRVCVVITAGFQELGAAGKALEAEIVRAARLADVAFVGPNCAGVTNPREKFYCMMQPAFPPAGGIAIVSQSGNIAGSIQHMCSTQDLGVSRCVSVGNQAFLRIEDFLEYFAVDDGTHVVAAYLEGVSDGPRFIEAARRLTRRKPLILLKGGKTETGTRAAKSHTGAIAGSSAVFDAVCRQCGVVRVDDVEDLFDTATAFLSQPLPAGNRVGIVANGGGWGVVAADACVAAGLDVVELPEETLRALDARLPAWWNRHNPVDLVAGMSRGAFFKTVEDVSQCEVVDAVLALGFGYARGNAAAFEGVTQADQPGVADYVAGTLHSDSRGAAFILDVIDRHRKPVLLASEFGVGADRDGNEAVLALRRKNVLVYPSPRRPAEVLARLARYGRYLYRQTNKS